jgi:hypothetical protein
MKQTVMLRILGEDTYKKVVEIDISKFKLKYRLRKDVIGVLDGIDVAMCVEDYETALNEQRKQALVEMMRLDEEAGLYDTPTNNI